MQRMKIVDDRGNSCFNQIVLAITSDNKLGALTFANLKPTSLWNMKVNQLTFIINAG